MKIRSKWVILQLLSLLCYITFFPAIFSAVPLALLRLEAPRKIYYVFISTTLSALTLYFGFIKIESLGFVFGYALVCFIGTLSAELLLKFYAINQDSVKGPSKFWTWYLTLALIPLLLGVLVMFAQWGTINPEGLYEKVEVFAIKTLSEPSSKEILAELKKSPATEASEAVALLENPKRFASQLLFLLPTYSIMAYFVVLFFTVFFLARLRPFLGEILRDDWIQEVVLNFKNPDVMIFGAIAALGWGLFYQKLPVSSFWIEHGSLLGSSLINLFGVFFFFQGLMCILHLFNLWGIKGFIGAIVLFVLLLVAMKLVALLGLLDMWIDFRKKNFFLNKDKNKNI